MVSVLDDADDRWQQYPITDFRYAYKKSDIGCYVSLFGDKLERITSYDDNDPTLFESDLNPEMKILLDLYPNNDDISKGHRILIYDIETSTEGGFPDVMQGDKAITAIATYDYTGDKYYSLILDPDKKVKNKTVGNEITKSFSTETELLTYFINLWTNINPTIISGWNINFFDNPYLYNRAKNVLGKSAVYKLSPLGQVYQNLYTKKMVIGGVSSLDYIDLYKKFCEKMKSSYSLANVAKDEELKHQKLTYKGNLDTLYKTDIDRFVEYNLVDVKVVVELNEKYDYINLALGVCHKGHIPYEWFQMSSRFIDGAIVDYLHANKLIAPNKPAGGREAYEEMENSDDEGFEGAYVKIPTPGIYEWVCSADITSLYPSVIMSLNISPDTKIGVVKDWDWNSFNNGNIKEINLNGMLYTIDEFNIMMLNHSISVSSSGVVYKMNKLGVIPTILDKWFSERVEYRKLAKKYAKEGNKEMAAFYNRRQLRQKIFLNSVYGVLGLPIFRFYDIDNAASVTSTGQTIIKYAEQVVNDLYVKKFNKYKVTPPKNDFIIYVDTDSNYFSTKELGKLENIKEEEMTDYTIKFVTEAADRINKFYEYMVPKVFNVSPSRNRIKIVPDVIAERSIWIAKKRYAMLKVYDMETMSVVKDKQGNIGQVKVMGIDTVRSSYPKFFKSVVGKVLEDILRGKDLLLIDEEIMEMEEKIPSIDAIDLAKTSSIKFISRKGDKHYSPKGRDRFDIVKGAPITAKSGNNYNDLLNIWKLNKQYDLIRHSDKCKWIYLLPYNPYAIDCVAFKGDDTDPDKLLEFIAQYVDKNKMYERELKSKLLEIYSAINRQLPNRGSQKALKTFDFSESW